MPGQDEYEWRWFRCSIAGCGATPLRVRPHIEHRGKWSVGFAEGPVWTMEGPAPTCPVCGEELEGLASEAGSRFAGR